MDTRATRRLAGEASQHLRRLLQIADTMRTGFDLATTVEVLARTIRSELAASRVAVFTAYDGMPPVPAVVQGHDESPWPEPKSGGGPLQGAVEATDGYAVDWADPDGSRWQILVQPMRADDRLLGFVVADRPAARPFIPDERSALARIADDYAPLFGASLLYAWLKARSSMEQQQRAIQEIHDGVAQELVALGFSVDALRLQLTDSAPEQAATVDGVRDKITAMVAELRDRMGETSGRAMTFTEFTTALLSRAHSVAAYAGLTLAVRVDDCGERLPAEVEALLYGASMDLLNDAALSSRASRIALEVEIGPGKAGLLIQHDGHTSTLAIDAFVAHPLAVDGAVLTFRPLSTRHGPSLRIDYAAADEDGDTVG